MTAEVQRLQDKADQWDAAQPMIKAMTAVVMAAQALTRSEQFISQELFTLAATLEALGKISTTTGEIPQKGADDAS